MSDVCRKYFSCVNEIFLFSISLLDKEERNYWSKYTHARLPNLSMANLTLLFFAEMSSNIDAKRENGYTKMKMNVFKTRTQTYCDTVLKIS